LRGAGIASRTGVADSGSPIGEERAVAVVCRLMVAGCPCFAP
jgi:hypothetical protein